MSTKKEIKTAVKKDVENLTKKDVEILQESAETRNHSFTQSFIELANKSNEMLVTKTTNRDIYFKIDSRTSHISRKEKYIVLYTTSSKYRNELLKRFKDTKTIKTCKTAKYLDSKESNLEIIFEDVNTVEASEAFIKSLINTVKKAQKLKADYEKELKEAK